MSDLPAPPVPAECDLRAFQYLPLDVVRLRDSELSAAASGDEFRAAVLLWCASWHQLPASSLPKDDRALAHLAGYGRDLKGWSKVRDGAMRGWQEANDGRLYHRVVSEKAAEAWKARLEQRARTEAARAAREAKRKRCSQPTTDHAGHGTTDDDTSYVSESVTDNATGSKGEGREREGKGKYKSAASPPPAPAHDPEDLFGSESTPTPPPPRIVSRQSDWPHWSQTHTRIFIARSDEHGNRSDWMALFDRAGAEIMSAAYDALTPSLPNGKGILFKQAAEWINRNTVEVA